MSQIKTWVNKVRPGTFPDMESGKPLEAPQQDQPLTEQEEEDKLFTETERTILLRLMERKRQLDERESMLNQREEQLRALRDTIQNQISAQKKIQQEIEAGIEAKKALDDANLKRMVALFDKMDAKKGADKLQALEPRYAAGILMSMNQRKASAVLGEMPADKARLITEEIVRKGPSKP
ncbi:MAG: hypothetical protein OEV94_06470 [Deltaproteobacteria bacterium]|nr:hypothetical protein [Deltaproteobacteria bacterium]